MIKADPATEDSVDYRTLAHNQHETLRHV
jgi:hypothetical protein